MTLTIADPLALMPRADVAAGAVPPAVLTGEGADFALALAGMMVAPAEVQGDAKAVDGGAVLAGPAQGAVPEGGAALAFGRVVPVGMDGAALVEALPVKAVSVVAQDAVPVVAGDIAVLPETVDVSVGQVPVGRSVAVEAGVGPLPADDVPDTVTAPEVAAAEAEIVPSDGIDAREVTAPAVVSLPVKAVLANHDAPAEDTGDADAAPEPLADKGEGSGQGAAVVAAVAAVVQAVVAPAPAEVEAGSDRPEDAPAEAVRTGATLPLPLRGAKPARAEGSAPETAKEGVSPDRAVEEAPEEATEKRAAPVRAVTAPETVQPAPSQEKRGAEAAALPKVDAVRTEAQAPAPQQSAPPAPPVATPAAQTVLPAPVAMDRPGWEAALADRIAAELSEDGQQIELDLAPERLGGLRITLEVTDGQAQVRFVTETAEAARLIQQNEHRLSESLSRAGLSLGGHESASRDAQGQQGDRPGRGTPRGAESAFQRAVEPRQAPGVGRAGSGLVNLIA